MLKKAMLFIFILSILSTGVFALEQNRLVAIVGDAIITQMDLDKAVSRLEAHLHATRPQNTVSASEIQKTALDNLIEDAIFMQILKKENLAIDSNELENQINNVIASYKLTPQQLAAELSLRGMTTEDYRQQIRMELLKRKIVDRVVKNRIVISDEQIDKYYQENGGRVNRGGMNLKAILLSIPSGAKNKQIKQVETLGEQLYKRLQQGEDFSALAKQYSQGPGADQGGDLGSLSLEDMLPQMREAVENLAPGQISELVEIPGHFAIFKIEPNERIPAADIPLVPSDTEKAKIREILETEGLNKRFKEWIDQVRSQIYVKVMI